MDSSHITYSIDDFSYLDRYKPAETSTVPSRGERNLISGTPANETQTHKGDVVELSQESQHSQKLSEADKDKIAELKQRDQEVRRHEESHRNAAGALASAPQYTYEQGPDGNLYATGGHVDINMSKGRTPEETIQKAQTIRRAALAPEDPSTQDQKVAADALKMEQEARADLQKEQAEQLSQSIRSGETSNAGHQSQAIGSSSHDDNPSSSPSLAQQTPNIPTEPDDDNPSVYPSGAVSPSFNIAAPLAKGQHIHFFA